MAQLDVFELTASEEWMAIQRQGPAAVVKACQDLIERVRTEGDAEQLAHALWTLFLACSDSDRVDLRLSAAQELSELDFVDPQVSAYVAEIIMLRHDENALARRLVSRALPVALSERDVHQAHYTLELRALDYCLLIREGAGPEDLKKSNLALMDAVNRTGFTWKEEELLLDALDRLKAAGKLDRTHRWMVRAILEFRRKTRRTRSKDDKSLNQRLEVMLAEMPGF